MGGAASSAKYESAPEASRRLRMDVPKTALEECCPCTLWYRIPSNLHHLSESSEEKRRVCVVAVDIGMARAIRHLDPTEVIRSRMLSSDYFCSQKKIMPLKLRIPRVREKHEWRRVDIQITPLQATERAQVVICFALETNILGNGAWFLLDSIRVTVHRSEPQLKRCLEDLVESFQEDMDFKEVAAELQLMVQQDFPALAENAEIILQELLVEILGVHPEDGRTSLHLLLSRCAGQKRSQVSIAGSNAPLSLLSACSSGWLEMKFRAVQQLLPAHGFDILMGGDQKDQQYMDRIHDEKGVVLAVCTQDYGGSNSKSTAFELQYAVEQGLTVLPLQVDDVFPPQSCNHEAEGPVRSTFRSRHFMEPIDCRRKSPREIAAMIAEKLKGLRGP